MIQYYWKTTFDLMIGVERWCIDSITFLCVATHEQNFSMKDIIGNCQMYSALFHTMLTLVWGLSGWIGNISV